MYEYRGTLPGSKYSDTVHNGPPPVKLDLPAYLQHLSGGLSWVLGAAA